MTKGSTAVTVAALAGQVGAEVAGDGDRLIERVADLAEAGAGALSFYSNTRFRDQLRNTKASAVLLQAEHREDCPTTALIVANPYYAYAVIAQLLHPRQGAPAGVHPSAVVAPDVVLGEGVSVGPNAVIEAGAQIGAGCEIGAGSYIGAGTVLGDGCVLANNVTVHHQCQLGERCVLYTGVVIGADGFGFAPGKPDWRKVPQLGRVIVGSDVEIGANSTIDRGTLKDTQIGAGVKIDNLVHIGHNVVIGDHTVVAGCTVIAGSTVIGKGCVLGGASAITGHIHITDGVTLMGMTGVTGNIDEAGVYASPLPAQPVTQWRRNTVRYTQLDDLVKRVQKLEKGG